MKRFKCCICGKIYFGYGNVPKPYANKGVCCDKCDELFVIPERIRLMRETKKETD